LDRVEDATAPSDAATHVAACPRATGTFGRGGMADPSYCPCRVSRVLPLDGEMVVPGTYASSRCDAESAAATAHPSAPAAPASPRPPRRSSACSPRSAAPAAHWPPPPRAQAQPRSAPPTPTARSPRRRSASAPAPQTIASTLPPSSESVPARPAPHSHPPPPPHSTSHAGQCHNAPRSVSFLGPRAPVTLAGILPRRHKETDLLIQSGTDHRSSCFDAGPLPTSKA
jgi:hypothetical protein